MLEILNFHRLHTCFDLPTVIFKMVRYYKLDKINAEINVSIYRKIWSNNDIRKDYLKSLNRHIIFKILHQRCSKSKRNTALHWWEKFYFIWIDIKTYTNLSEWKYTKNSLICKFFSLTQLSYFFMILLVIFSSTTT